MSEPYNRSVNLEEAARQLLEEDESIIGSSESDLSDDDETEYIPHVVERNMDENSDSDVKAFIESLRSAENQGESESESDSEDSMTTTLNITAIQASSSSHTQVPCSMPLSSTSQAFPASTFSNQSASEQPSDMDSRTGKDGAYWSSTSSPQGRFRSHNVIRPRLSTVLSSEVYTPKSAFELFISDNIVDKILLCTNLQGRRACQKWKHVSKEKFMAFIGVLLLTGAEKNWDLDIPQLFSDPLKILPTKLHLVQADLKTYAVTSGSMISEHELHC